MSAEPIKGLDELAPGTRVGRYEIVGPLGAGGMGRVHRARDPRLGRDVAIKTLDPRVAGDRSRRRRFEREARIAGAVSHPNVIVVLDVGEWQGQPYFVSELLNGRTLRELLRPGTLSVGEAVEYAVQACRGLQAIHDAGIVHRDLKPENVFVTSDGRVKVLDLGLAGSAPDEDAAGLESTQDSAYGGTVAYMAPEQVRRQKPDARTDVFACGVMLYEMLGRRRPFAEETAVETMTAILRREPEPLERLDPALPRALVRIVERCLRKPPEERFHSAHDLALALEACSDAAAVAPAAAAPRSPAPPRDQRATGLVLALVLAVVLGTSTWWWERTIAGAKGIVHAGSENAELVRYDATGKRFETFLPGVAAQGVDTSADGRWIAYTTYPDGELWRARANGTEARRLTTRPLEAALPRWSPDGTRIAFCARAQGRPWQIHLIPADGGAIEVLAPENSSDPGWTADGRAIVMGTSRAEEPGALLEWDVESRRLTIVPGSHGLFSPRPSPDGRFLAAIDPKTYELALLDRASGEWRRTGRTGLVYPEWSRDGAWLHARRDGSFLRIEPKSGREEPVARLDGPAVAGGEWGAWSGLAPDDAPLVLVAKDPTSG